MILLVIDPGLDVFGYAIYRAPERRPITPRDFRDALVASGSWATSPTTPLPQRLFQLHQGVAAIIAEHRPDLAFLEVPVTSNAYARNERAEKGRGFHAGLAAPANQAIGALLLALQLMALDTRTIPASKMEKKQKSAWVVNIWPELGNRKSNADQRDAIHLGGAILTQPHLWAAPHQVAR